MNTRNHLPWLVVCVVVLAGCGSLEVPRQDGSSDSPTAPPGTERSAPPAVDRMLEPVVDRSAEPPMDQMDGRVPERTAHMAMTIPRPQPPAAEPLELETALPEPELAARSAVELILPDRNLEFNLAPSSLAGVPGKIRVLVFGPSSRALAAAVRPPAASRQAAAEMRKTAEVPKPAQNSETAAAKTPTKVARTPAAVTRPQSAASSGSATQSQASRPAAVSKPVEIEAERRELVARKGDPIAIDLEGSGWIYTGLKSGGVFSNTAEDQGIDFLSRQSSGNRTSFNFKAVDYGEYELAFQFQDHQQAVQRSRVVHLRVVPEQEFTAAVQRQTAFQTQQAGSNTPLEGTDQGIEPVPGPPIPSADTLFELGEYDLALVEYKRNMRGGDPYLNDRLAECYERTGEYLAAVKYYRENLVLKGEYGQRAVLGLVRSSIATEDSRLLLEVLPSLYSLDSVQIGTELLGVARFQTEDRRFSVAIQALEQYIRRYPEGRKLDEVYFRLARIYEVDSPYRDIESARHYYSLLYESFPESLYVEPAAERLDYLNRHFFLVQ
jgi:tetratricopeptide (TPR) repeat protein